MNAPIPAFEGHVVQGTAIQLSGSIPMDDLEGAVFGVDDVVQLVAQFTCVAVHHRPNKDGELIRHQVLRPIFMSPSAILDGDTSAENYIMRSLPRPSASVVAALPSADDDEDED